MKVNDLVPGLRKGVWISPSKKRLPFDFVGPFEFTQSKKLSFQEVPLSDSWVIQDLGLGITTFTLEMVFGGADADKKCEEMVAALGETGSGMLLHPCGKDILCIAQEIKHHPTSLDSIRLARIAVSFIKTLKQPYPAIQQDYEGDIKLAQEELLGPSPSLAERINKFTQDDLTQARKTLTNIVSQVSSPLQWVAEISTETSNLFFQAQLEIKNLLTLDAPVIQTLQSLGNMVSIPARVDFDLAGKQQAYKDALNAIGLTNNPDDTIAEQIRWQSIQTIACAGFMAFENADIQGADIAATFIKNNTEIYQWILAESVLTPESLDQVLRLLNLSTNALMHQAVSLPRRRSKILENDSNAITQAYEIYGSADKLDDFLRYNKLTAEQNLLLPRGMEIVWYG